MTTLTATAWAVVSKDGIDLRTVGPTRRSAIVNWLWVSPKVRVYDHHSDAWIEQSWQNLHGEGVDVVEVVVACERPMS